MTTLAEQIRLDLTESMKAREVERTSTLRMLQSALKNEQIERGADLSDDETRSVIRKAVKQRQDSIEQYTSGGRPELAAKEASELAMLETYLPAMLSSEQTEALLKGIIAKVEAVSKKDMGRVMKEVMAHHKSDVDGRKVQEILGRLLS